MSEYESIPVTKLDRVRLSQSIILDALKRIEYIASFPELNKGWYQLGITAIRLHEVRALLKEFQDELTASTPKSKELKEEDKTRA